jgi:hypothetical protein
MDSNRLQDKLVCVYIEELIEGVWTRHRRLGFGLHPAYARDQIKLLRKYHPGQKYRTVEVRDEDILLNRPLP